MKNTLWSISLTAFVITSCGEAGGGAGNLLVVLGAEATIPGGLQSGAAEENILDGYGVQYDNFIVSVGDIRMLMLGQHEQTSDTVYVVDMTDLSTTGLTLVEFTGIPVGQYDQFGFQTPIASNISIKDDNVTQADFDAMIANGWSYLIRGVLKDDGGTPGDASDDGQVVDRRFEIGADVPSVYTSCGVQDAQMLGINVAPESSAEVTIHGDHLFFNGFPTEEGTVLRLAQWLADIEDTDDDDVITKVDFEAATDLGSLFPAPPEGDYELTGGPLPITNAWDFVRAQLGSQGHIQGEGECEWSTL